MIIYGQYSDSPVGAIWIAATRDGLRNVQIGGDELTFIRLSGGDQYDFDSDSPLVTAVADQLREYFEGLRKAFEITLDWRNLTDFQRAALLEATKIPYGEVRTYGQLARQMGRSIGAARAVGRAMASNPWPIVVPCHRVVGARGELTGYGGAGGIETKAWLLNLEGYKTARQGKLPW